MIVNNTLMHNTGLLFINKPEVPLDKKTVVVLGAPRGGTSMISGVLYHLGIFMGENLRATYEDSLLIHAIMKNQIETIEDIVEQRNTNYDTWGWKQPHAFEYFFSNVVEKLRNPIYIAIFRDSFAVANRNRISVKANAISNMRNTLKVYLKITDFIDSTASPCLLVSYEKVISNKEVFVNELSQFLCIKDENKIKDAIEFIQPSPEKYLIEESPVDSMGVLDRVDQKIVAGWAMFRHSINDIAKVRLLINNKHEIFVEAGKFRPDLLSAGIHPTGKCGFVFELPEKLQLKAGDKINAYVGGGSELRNSPKHYYPAVPVPPKSMIIMVGGDFEVIGEKWKKYFIKSGLPIDAKILDVGCGVGRMARPLTSYLSSYGEYQGFDIVKEGIDWCQANITTKYPNFVFQHSDIYNKFYNPSGVTNACDYNFPFSDNYFDFVFLTSVFTHMLPKDINNYLSEITRVMKKNAICVISYFLLNDEAARYIQQGKSTINFKYKIGEDCLAKVKDAPEAALAYRQEFIFQLYKKYNLEVKSPIHYGIWCGRQTNSKFYQDIITAIKIPL